MTLAKHLASFLFCLFVAATTAPLAQAQWQTMSGQARDIAIGADKYDSVFIVGRSSGIYTWVPRSFSWSDVGGEGNRIAVAADGMPWITTREGTIYRRQGNAWQKLPGGAADIAAGPDGSVWIIGKTSGSVYKWSDSTYGWVRYEGEGSRIAVGGAGVWVVTERGAVYRRREDERWKLMPGKARDVAVSPEGDVWVVGESRDVYAWDFEEERWRQVPGEVEGSSITAGRDGVVWVVAVDGKVYRRASE